MPDKVPMARRPAVRSLASVSYNRRDDRREAKAFYKSRPWRLLRAAILAEEPLCIDCTRMGRVVVAVDVHHVLERRDRPDLALDPGNLEPLCKRHHAGRRRGGVYGGNST